MLVLRLSNIIFTLNQENSCWIWSISWLQWGAHNKNNKVLRAASAYFWKTCSGNSFFSGRSCNFYSLCRWKLHINDCLSLAASYTLQNAYVSTGGSCGHFHHDNSMSYIQNPIPGDQTNLDGFFLHRVSPLEMVSLGWQLLPFSEYQFGKLEFTCNFFLWTCQETLLINLEGEVVQRSVVHQHGRGAM